MSQTDIDLAFDSVFSGKETFQISATRGQGEVTVSYAEVLELAQEAFITGGSTSCGDIEYTLDDNSGLLFADMEQKTLSVKPSNFPDGLFSDAYLKFYLPG